MTNSNFANEVNNCCAFNHLFLADRFVWSPYFLDEKALIDCLTFSVAETRTQLKTWRKASLLIIENSKFFNKELARECVEANYLAQLLLIPRNSVVRVKEERESSLEKEPTVQKSYRKNGKMAKVVQKRLSRIKTNLQVMEVSGYKALIPSMGGYIVPDGNLEMAESQWAVENKNPKERAKVLSLGVNREERYVSTTANRIARRNTRAKARADKYGKWI
jgi:hypothetical protein